MAMDAASRKAGAMAQDALTMRDATIMRGGAIMTAVPITKRAAIRKDAVMARDGGRARRVPPAVRTAAGTARIISRTLAAPSPAIEP
jgi:hypothetical protein